MTAWASGSPAVDLRRRRDRDHVVAEARMPLDVARDHRGELRGNGLRAGPEVHGLDGDAVGRTATDDARAVDAADDEARVMAWQGPEQYA